MLQGEPSEYYFLLPWMLPVRNDRKHCSMTIKLIKPIPAVPGMLSLRCFGIIPAYDTHTHTHTRACQSSSHHRSSLGCMARLCLGVDSKGCFINPARIHQHISPAASGWREVMIQLFFFFVFCSVKCVPSIFQKKNIKFCYRVGHQWAFEEGKTCGKLSGVQI